MISDQKSQKVTFYLIAKRTMDLAGAVILLIIFLPVMISTSVVIKLTSPGPIFADTPDRVGKNG